MPSVPARMSSVRKIPWLLVFRTGQLVWAHLRDDLTPHDRRRLGSLVRIAPHRMTAQERNDLLTIVRKVDLSGLGRELFTLRSLHR